MPEFKKISILDDNMPECIALSVFPWQSDFVAGNAQSLGEAYDTNRAGNGSVAVPYAIYEDGKMVGFVMYGYFPPEAGEDAYSTDEHIYYVWRLFIDKNHQGRGLGRAALSFVMDEIKTKPHGAASYCYSSYIPANTASKATFAAYGFEEDGRVLGGEVVMRYRL